MHGRKKAEYKARLSDPEVSTKIAQKANQWNVLSRELLLRRGRLSPPEHTITTTNSDESVDLSLTEKLLSVNPDPGHIWNQRRELLLKNETFFNIEKELHLTTVCLKRNPKAYGAWHHRKWSIRHCASENWDELLASELRLCADFLQLDERNFHCWNYRRFVVAASALNPILSSSNTSDNTESEAHSLDLDGSWHWYQPQPAKKNITTTIMGPQILPAKNITTTNNQQQKLFKLKSITSRESILQAEWNFTREKIERNFSNFSAFHYRSKLIPLVLHAEPMSSPQKCHSKALEMAKEELTLVQNAIFTEPDDQTAWWYHRFIIDFASPRSHGLELLGCDAQDSYLECLEEECQNIRELIDCERGRCKWGLLALHMILCKINEVGVCDGDVKEDANACLVTLKEIDPDRGARYESMMS